MHRIPIVLMLALALFPGAAAGDSRSRFRDIWQAEWAWRLAQHPQLATSVGVHVYDDRLGDVGPAAQAERLHYWRKVRDQLRNMNPHKLDGSTRIEPHLSRADRELHCQP